jgi:hypothetical protein
MDDKNLIKGRNKKSAKPAKVKELTRSENISIIKELKLEPEEDCEGDKNDKELTGFGAYLGSLPKYPLLKEEEEAKLVKLAQGKSK